MGEHKKCEKGRMEGRKKVREAIFKALEVRFGEIDPELKKAIEEIEDPQLLENIFEYSLTAEALSEVRNPVWEQNNPGQDGAEKP